MPKRDLSDMELFFESGVYIPSRTLYVGDYYGMIEEALASEVIKGLHILEMLDSEKEVNVILNSLGGCTYDGFAIYDALLSSPCKINIVALGACMSMGTIVLQAGDYRMLTGNTVVMIHDGSDGYDGEIKNFENWGEWSRNTYRNYTYNVYLRRMKESNKKITVKKIEEMCRFDNIFTAQKAVKLGLADVVV